jgi:signal transduction histidine kinase
MINTKIFRRHYAITAFTISVFMFLGFQASHLLMRLSIEHLGPQPPVFFAKLVDDIDAKDHVRALKHIESLDAEYAPFHLAILDASGRNVSDSAPGLAENWDKIKKPVQPYGYERLEPNGEGPPGPGGPGGHPEEGVIRLLGEPAQYLYVSPRPHPGPSLLFFLATFGSLVVSILLGVGFSLYLLFRSMRERMESADFVIAELQRGNLKARFPIKRLDEMGLAMTRFNKMAEEIERLVERLRSVEKSRMALLQELAHDLRTPVASLKNLLATVDKKGDSMDKELRAELMALSRKEVEYFERLVEDLLVLARVSEPGYHADRAPTALATLLEDEAQAVSNRYEAQGKRLRLQLEEGDRSGEVSGDPHLLRRMFRNALDNAFSFARSEVSVSIESKTAGELEVVIRDDGPGMPADVLKTFGERRVSRKVETSQDNRLSVGLGSVIMKTVAEIHRGKLVASNRVDGSGKILGADVRLTIPCRPAQSLKV